MLSNYYEGYFVNYKLDTEIGFGKYEDKSVDQIIDIDFNYKIKLNVFDVIENRNKTLDTVFFKGKNVQKIYNEKSYLEWLIINVGWFLIEEKTHSKLLKKYPVYFGDKTNKILKSKWENNSYKVFNSFLEMVDYVKGQNSSYNSYDNTDPYLNPFYNDQLDLDQQSEEFNSSFW